MFRFWRIEVSPLGQPCRANSHTENSGGVLVVAASSNVGVGQLSAHSGITPAGLLCPLSVNGLARDQAMEGFRFAQCFRRRVRAHGALPTLRLKAAEGGHEGFGAQVAAQGFDAPLRAKPMKAVVRPASTR
jgi:hypothetical protein